MSRPSVREAIDRLTRAVELDPDLASAHAELARAYMMQTFGTIDRYNDPSERMRSAAEAALRLDPKQAVARAALGFVHWFAFRWEEAEREFREAVRLNASDAKILSDYGFLLSLAGRHEEGIAYQREAMAASPLDPTWRAFYARGFFYAGKAERCVEEYEKLKRLFPDSGFHFYAWYAWALMALGREEEAARASAVDPRGFRGAPWVDEFERLIAQKGPRDAYLYWRDMETRSPEPVSYMVATLCCITGEPEEALPWLERALRERSWLLVNMGVTSYFDPLRQHPRFQAVAKVVGGGTRHVEPDLGHPRSG